MAQEKPSMTDDKDDTGKKKTRKYYSPSSKLPVMTPIRSALYIAKKRPKDFIKKVQELLDSKKIQKLADPENNKENVKE